MKSWKVLEGPFKTQCDREHPVVTNDKYSNGSPLNLREASQNIQLHGWLGDCTHYCTYRKQKLVQSDASIGQNGLCKQCFHNWLHTMRVYRLLITILYKIFVYRTIKYVLLCSMNFRCSGAAIVEQRYYPLDLTGLKNFAKFVEYKLVYNMSAQFWPTLSEDKLKSLQRLVNQTNQAVVPSREIVWTSPVW